MRNLLLASLLLSALPLCAREQMLVSAEWLQRHHRQVTILHIGEQDEYDSGHIPGAVLIEMSSLVVSRDSIPNELPAVKALEDVFRAAGIGSTGPLVVYSRNPLFATRAWFTLDYLGHGGRVMLLDGGVDKWLADGCAASFDRVVAGPGSFQARVIPRAVTSHATMRELVRRRALFRPNLVIIDSRADDQYRSGHIPGAVSVPSASNFAEDGTLRPREELREIYARAGISRATANIVYCRSGMQATVTYFVLEYLGYEALLYDGSYLEWTGQGETIES